MNFTIFNIVSFVVLTVLLGDEIQQPYKQLIHGTDENVEMVFIPGGTFTMGSPKSEKNHFGDEGPQHEIEIAPLRQRLGQARTAHLDRFPGRGR